MKNTARKLFPRAKKWALIVFVIISSLAVTMQIHGTGPQTASAQAAAQSSQHNAVSLEKQTVERYSQAEIDINPEFDPDREPSEPPFEPQFQWRFFSRDGGKTRFMTQGVLDESSSSEQNKFHLPIDLLPNVNNFEVESNEIQPTATGAISGTVTSAEGSSPLSGITVCVFPYYGGAGNCVSTGAGGQYLVSGLAAGSYTANILWSNGWAFQIYNNTTSSLEAEMISVYGGQTTTGIDFALEPGGTGTGSVKDAYQNPLDSLVWFDFGSISLGACTETDGTFIYSSIPYDLPFTIHTDGSCSGESLYIDEYWEDTLYSYEATELTVNQLSPTISGIDFVLDLGGIISGRVTSFSSGSPISGVTVWAYGESGSEYGWTDYDGYYQIGGLPPGQYWVDVQTSGYAFEYYNNKHSWSEADLVTVSSGLTTTGINFALDPGGSVAGRVTDEGGAPLSSILLTFRFEGGDYYSACTNSEGDYYFDSIPYNSAFRVGTSGNCYDNYGDYVDEYWQDTQYYWEATLLNATAQHPHITGINFVLALGGSISGTVTNAQNGLPLPNIFVSAESNLSTSGGYGWTDSNGEYTVTGLPEGSARVEIYQDGFALEYYNDKRTWASADLVPVVAGTDTPGIDFALSPGGIVSGVVRDTIGTPVSDICVGFEIDNEVWWWGISDASGQYDINILPYDIPVVMEAGESCGNPDFYETEYWQEADNIAEATPLTFTESTPSYADIDFTLEQVIPTFTDVPPSHPLFDYIEALYAAGYTSGCSTDPLMYCPDSIMNRAESAVFMLRGAFGASYAPNPTPSGILKDDWSPGYWAEKWAEAMVTEGLSSGCSANPLKYCPWVQLTRQEASVFGLRMMSGMDYVPPAAAGNVFADMTDPAFWATKWAEQAYADGLLPACGELGGKPLFCPNDLVDRGWGAYLVVTAKDLLGE